MRLKAILSLTSCACALAAGAPVLAADGASAEDNGLEDIVVTAQRREENLQKAAIAVSAVSGDSLTQQSITQATDLTRLVPSLQVATGASFVQIYLRGVGTFGSNAFAEQGVAFNLDGVYLSRPAAPAGLFYDIERIEVLKGPQGTLYGRNATGGAMNVITAKPKLGETSGYVTAEYGNYDALKAQGAVNVPLGERAAFRIAAQHVKRDGYYSDGYDDEDTNAVRGQLLFDSQTGFDATFMVDYAKVGGMGSGGTIMPLLDGKNRLGPSDPAVLAEYLSRAPTFPVPQIKASDDGYQNNRFFGVQATINADLGFATLTVVPAFRKTDLDFLSYASSFKIDVTENSDQMSFETRLANDGDRLKWVAGAYYFAESVSARQHYDQASNGTIINSELQTTSKALFGEATWSFTDRFRVTGGLRYTSDNKKQNSETHTLPFVGFVPPGPPNWVPIILDIQAFPVSDYSASKVTWKAGVEYDVADASLLYATAATGYKSGVLFPAVGVNNSDPELLTAYTIGSKNRFFDNHVQLNVEAFYWDYKGQQISHLGAVQVATTPGGPIYGPLFLTENAGKAKIWGAEAELLWQITPNDRFNANLQYLNAKYDELTYLAYSTGGGAPVNGCPTTLTTLTGASPAARIYSVDCSGKPVVNAPRWSLNAGYEHMFDLGPSGNIRVGADTRIESERYLSIDFLDLGKQGSYMMSNAHITYETASGNFSVTGFINNIENELVFANSFQSPVKSGVIYNQLRPPRTYGIRGTVRF